MLMPKYTNYHLKGKSAVWSRACTLCVQCSIIFQQNLHFKDNQDLAKNLKKDRIHVPAVEQNDELSNVEVGSYDQKLYAAES